MSESIAVDNWRTMLERYAAAVERGDVVTPEDFDRRCVALGRRGLSMRMALAVREAGRAALLREVEALDADGLRALNDAGRPTIP